MINQLPEDHVCVQEFRAMCLDPVTGALPRNYIAQLVSKKHGIDFRVRDFSMGEEFIEYKK